MSSQRLFAAGPLAGLATIGLFLTMNGLVADGGEVQLDERPPLRIVDYVQENTTPPVPENQWVVDKPEPVEPAPIIDPLPGTHGGDPVINIGPYIPPKPEGPTGLNPGNLLVDGDKLPLVRVQPEYPRRAIERGIEGYVVVSLTVAADGTVPYDSIVIADAEPAGVFDRAAKKAAAKFKYKPKVVNGVALPESGVQFRFSFNMKN